VRLPPFALDKVRILDLAWVVAGAAGPRVLVGFGAEDIRVEWKGRLDSMRSGGTVIPVGEERKRLLAGESFVATRVGINQGGTFHEVNPGKRSISLNLAHPKGKDLLKELVRVCDIVVENFTARTMEGFGLGYEELRKVNPSIIYVQQPGFGKKGLYANYLSSAPVGEAFTGLTEMSGLPTPYPPAGWGYLYMDNSGSYYCAMAMLNALYYRARTGKGQYIDSSLAEPALFLLVGTALLGTGQTSLAGLFGQWHQSPAFVWLAAPAVGVLFVLLQAEAARVPVDDPATHLELTMVHEVMVLDHSGPELAAMQYAAAIKMTVYAGLIAALLNPFDLGTQPAPAVLAALAIMAAVAVAVGCVESLTARLRLRHVPPYLALATLIAALGLGAAGWLAGAA